MNYDKSRYQPPHPAAPLRAANAGCAAFCERSGRVSRGESERARARRVARVPVAVHHHPIGLFVASHCRSS